MFKVAILGAESFNDVNFCCSKCIKILKGKNDSGELIEINTIGDTFVNEFAKFYRIDCQYYLVDSETHGKDAFSIRNQALIDDSDAFIVFLTDCPKRDVKILYKMIIESGKPYRVLHK